MICSDKLHLSIDVFRSLAFKVIIDGPFYCFLLDYQKSHDTFLHKQTEKICLDFSDNPVCLTLFLGSYFCLLRLLCLSCF